MNFLKTGAAAVHAAMEKDDIERASRFKPFRFWIERGEETRFTFLDGGIESGVLVPGVAFLEHMLKKTGSKGFDNICCVQEEEDCPICLDGDRPSLVFAMTILDHTEWKDKDGKLHEHQRRLFVCKGDTFKMLQMKAMKPTPGTSETAPMGLQYVTFNVGRVGEKSPGVGNVFDFVARTNLDTLVKLTKMTAEDLQPLDYTKAITVLKADDLRKIGHGQGSKSALGSADSKALGGEAKLPEASLLKIKTPFNPAAEM